MDNGERIEVSLDVERSDYVHFNRRSARELNG